MDFNNNLESFKNKKDLIEELEFYKSIILKKVKSGDYNSALEKVRSALVLIEEHQGTFNIEKEIRDFYEIKKYVDSELKHHRLIYERRFNNLLREELNELNLENFSKLLAMLKNDIDQDIYNYHLEDINVGITKYFKFIKRLYEILSCYKVLNYNDASGKIFEFVKEIKTENYPNLKLMISSIYKKLLSYRLQNYSKEFEKISISTLSKKMKINQDQLIDFIKLIKRQPKSPIKYYTSDTHEVYFKKPSI
ncbi:hypothetical protein LCGC14_0865050 [marine sediment metagenome]|uniref:PCI domain-containing protein n=1 Tax=marine sediment metagenome TaxID=412755 RepID=A0A0F9SDD5_9ZZZZ|nr:MAG: hypothetical protein Lokiarch_43570 [Candidatus Lokiarchaeum sp. GC14_75]